VVAYVDNASVIEGFDTARLLPVPPAGGALADALPHTYAWRDERTHILMKVETHNHPTAISPFAGAATGAGGEIRDEFRGAAGVERARVHHQLAVAELPESGRRLSPGDPAIPTVFH
jgi:phosphoribosylformylglycinamidine synthase